jgi:putative peptidoglycan lipid II flippase
MGEQRNIARAAGLMSAATMISRVLGYVRDMVIAFYLGATQISDAFFLAFRIPNLLRELFAEGSTASAVIPVLTEYEGTDRAEAARLVRIAFGFVVVVSGAVTVLGVVFAPQIVSVIGSGFTSEAQISLTVTLTRMMFPFLFFISLASVAMGALNTRRVFFVPAVAPAFLNICIIAMTFTIAVQYGRPVMGAALGVSLGGLVQFLVQVPLMKRHGYRLMPLINFNHPGLRKILKLVLPMTFTISVSQIYVLVASIIATYLPEGSITYLFYSMRLIHFPIGVFGVAMGMAVLPSLSAHAHRGDLMSVKEDFSFSLRLLFFITVPAMAGLIALREPIINLLFQHGNVWDYTATKKTGQALLFYSLGIWAVVGVRVMTSTFYSLQALMGPMLHNGLALAHAAAATLNFTILFLLLRRHLGGFPAREIVRSFLRAAAASAVMGVFCALVLRGEHWQSAGNSGLKAAWLAGTIVLAIGVYAGVSALLRTEELSFVVKLLKTRGRKETGDAG